VRGFVVGGGSKASGRVRFWCMCVGGGGKWSLIRSRNGEFHYGIVVSAELG
jgi:hypothetical protein